MRSCILSVVTPTLNRAAMLRNAIASLSDLRSVPFEHVVVDGGSIDSTCAVARAFGATVIEAPKSSIYEAINLGLGASRGEFICLLNDDDLIVPQGVLSAIRMLEENNGVDLVRGRSLIERNGGGIVHTSDNRPDRCARPSLSSILFGPANLNACVFRRRLCGRIGNFNAGYRIAADREWLLRAVLSGVEMGGVEDVVCVYRAHPESLTMSGRHARTMAWLEEHVRFAAATLHRPIPDRHRMQIRAFHARETAHLALLQLMLAGPPHALAAIAQGFAHDPAWPLFAASPITASIGQLVRRRFQRGREQSRAHNAPRSATHSVEN